MAAPATTLAIHEPCHVVECIVSDLVESLVGNVDKIPEKFILPSEYRVSVSSLTKSGDEIPVIDMDGLNDERRAQTLAVMHKACVEWGFFQVVNHGVALSVMENMKQQVEEFLALPVHERAPGGVKKGVTSHGYGSGYVKPDTGAMDWRDYLLLRTYPQSKRDYNTWPKIAAFREVIGQYSMELKRLSEKLLACFSESLGLPPTYIQDAVGDVHQEFLINHYPPCPQPDLAIGANKHTDLGAISCLWQLDDAIGLQVLKDGEWVPVQPVPGAYIINVADMVEIISNGIYKSIQHRAVVNTSRRPVSIAVFHDLPPQAVVKPARELITPECPALYKPTRFVDHAMKLAIDTHKIGETAVD